MTTERLRCTRCGAQGTLSIIESHVNEYVCSEFTIKGQKIEPRAIPGRHKPRHKTLLSIHCHSCGQTLIQEERTKTAGESTWPGPDPRPGNPAIAKMIQEMLKDGQGEKKT